MVASPAEDWFRCESHFVQRRHPLADTSKGRGLLSESDAVQPRIGKKALANVLTNPHDANLLGPGFSSRMRPPCCRYAKMIPMLGRVPKFRWEPRRVAGG